jgi:hypothetical protein
LIWTEEVKTNIKKFYKSETSNDLLQEKPVTFAITSKINDFSLFDGQINPVLDFAKSIDPNSKFTNIKRNKIGLDILKTTYGVSMSNLGLSRENSNSNSILDTYYYVYASPAVKAYLFLLTTPIDNITDFYKIFTIGGMYKITKMQMAWVAGQFWRAKYIKDFGEDIFVNIFKSFLDSGIDNLDPNNIELLGTMLTNLSNDTKKYYLLMKQRKSEFPSLLFQAENLEDCALKKEQLLAKISELDVQSEGLHMVENILLRPLESVTYLFSFVDAEGEEFIEGLYPSDMESQRSMGEDMLGFGLQVDNYSIVNINTYLFK